MVIVLLLCSIFRGTKKKESVVGVKRCEDLEWGLFGILIGSGIFLTIIAIVYLSKLHSEKVKKGYVFEKGDFEGTAKNIALLIVVSLIGGFLISCAGIGGGLIFNPFLLIINLPPAVAAATGMYLSLFTTGVATMVNCLNVNMPFTYMGTLFVFTVIGTFPGLYGQTWLVHRTNRPSTTVLVLVCLIGYCIIA